MSAEILDLSDEAVRRRRGAEGAHGYWNNGVCDACGGSIYTSGECLCSVEGAQRRPLYDPDVLIVEVDPNDKHHSVFYANQHFSVNASETRGYIVRHTSTTDPAVTGRLDRGFDGHAPDDLHRLAAQIRDSVDVGMQARVTTGHANERSVALS